ncbi:hypothetical protein KIPB_011919 [Kipferlia bialata]|uniref:Uncharacterized protein n=1 Tax=Kipferlia bialata TaxID=797122 RepID=A0A9K3D763_9EUKA|nr:hypothetical protein KIPB_011919 [Kipferlia bialata]|eukprot:g11919.t1
MDRERERVCVCVLGWLASETFIALESASSTEGPGDSGLERERERGQLQALAMRVFGKQAVTNTDTYPQVMRCHACRTHLRPYAVCCHSCGHQHEVDVLDGHLINTTQADSVSCDRCGCYTAGADRLKLCPVCNKAL